MALLPIVIPQFGFTRPTSNPTLNTDLPLSQGMSLFHDDRTLLDLVTGRRGSINSGTLLRSQGPPFNGQTRGFNATFGGGTSDKVFAATGTDATYRTYSMWVYRNGNGGSGFGICFSLTNAFGLGYDSGPGQMYCAHSFNTVGMSQYLNTTPALNTWALITVTYELTAGVAPVFYVNGVLAASTATGTSVGTPTAPSGLWIIGNGTSPAFGWDGMLGPLMIWDRILTPGEIYSLYDPSTRWSLYEQDDPELIWGSITPEPVKGYRSMAAWWLGGAGSFTPSDTTYPGQYSPWGWF